MSGKSSEQIEYECATLLKEFGFNEYEAYTFIYLLRLGTGTAKDIAEVDHVPRTRVYDAVDALQEAGLVDFPDASTYCTAKGAIANLTRELAVELGGEGIRVNAINPGVIETAMTTEDANVVGSMTDQIPLERDGVPEDVASVATFLASDEAAYITGHNLVVDGGYLAT